MIAHPFDRLIARDHPPTTVRAIETWIQQAEGKIGIGARRLGWMVASAVVIAALQRARHDDGHPRFLVKGGTYLELRLGLKARATKDLDTLFRGSFDDFLDVLDGALAEPFCGITFQRTEPQPIEVPGRPVKPCRFDVLLQFRGRTWRRIPLEVSPDEGRAGARAEYFSAPSLAHFGLTTPSSAAGIVIDYQVAQKLHACTESHSRERPNDRVRDVVDLQILRAAFYEGKPNLRDLAEACQDVFATRAHEAELTRETPSRTWPPTLVAYPHWQYDYASYVEEVGLEISLDEAVQKLNAWIAEIGN
jgi:hypothetical protein